MEANSGHLLKQFGASLGVTGILATGTAISDWGPCGPATWWGAGCMMLIPFGLLATSLYFFRFLFSKLAEARKKGSNQPSEQMPPDDVAHL
jgi:hypothetical protein